MHGGHITIFFSTYIKRVSWLMTDSVNQAEIAILASNNHLPWKMAKYFFSTPNRV